VATVTKRTIKGTPYYYLQQTLRADGKFKHKSKYLGREIPKDIKRIKSQFELEINKERWFDRFDAIKKNYRREFTELPTTVKDKQLRQFSIKFTYNTQRIEGSTLTLRETAQLIEEGISPSGKPRSDVEEAEAHNRLFLAMLKEKRDLTLPLVMEWNRELLKETKPDVAGRIRRYGVGISGSEFVPPTPVELQPMILDFFKWYNGHKGNTHAVELAALVHLKFVTIHPFGDGNGRVSRLMMNHVLNRNGYPMLNIEYKNRNSYYRALERSQVKRQDTTFSNWLFRRYLQEYKRYEAA
jgi:Fic family protein